MPVKPTTAGLDQPLKLHLTRARVKTIQPNKLNGKERQQSTFSGR
jgi:hypothetical protein